MPQLGASLTDCAWVIIYDPNMFIIQASRVRILSWFGIWFSWFGILSWRKITLTKCHYLTICPPTGASTRWRFDQMSLNQQPYLNNERKIIVRKFANTTPTTVLQERKSDAKMSSFPNEKMPQWLSKISRGNESKP
jgi:hypothetical protein